VTALGQIAWNLPEGTYGVRCEFHPGGQQYTYLVDPSQGNINAGADVVVATPKGGYNVIFVCGRADNLSPVDLKHMKYIVQQVDRLQYDWLMHNFLAGDPAESIIDESEQTGARFNVSTSEFDDDIIDEGDGDVSRGDNVPGNTHA